MPTKNKLKMAAWHLHAVGGLWQRLESEGLLASHD